MVQHIFMVYGLQLRKSQKEILAGIFSLGFVIAIVDILSIECFQSDTFSGVILWSSLDVTLAVVVGSLSLYRALLTGKGRKSLLSRSSIGHYKDVSDG